jgi:thermitase
MIFFTMEGFMKRYILLAALFVASNAFAGEYIVKYKNAQALKSITLEAQQKSAKFHITDKHDNGSYVVVDIPKSQEGVTLANLLQRKDIAYVVPNAKVHAFRAPIEIAALQQQWAIVKVNAEKAWQRAGNKGNRNVTVAVIDTGVDYKHKNLAPNMVAGYDYKDNDSDPMDITGSQNPGHGTHCAGAIGATGLIDGGTVGSSPEVSIMPVRFLGEDGGGDLNNAIKAIDFAVEKGAQVISASWGATIPRNQAQPLLDAIKRADDKGVIFVSAAANDGKNNDTTEVFPANSGFPNTITVAASGSSDSKPYWSNFGKATVHVASPGESILSTLPGDKYGNLDGTSMATPLVSGVVAFLKAQDPSLTGAQIRALIQTTGAKVNIETACNCRIDMFAAVDHLLAKKMWLVPAAATIEENASMSVSVMNGKSPFKFKSSNPSVITVDDSGNVKGVTKGTAQITVTDADGKSMTSLDYTVGKASGGGGGGGGLPDPGNPGDPGNPPDMGQCPVQDPQLCQILCQIMPDMPFCKSP